MMKAKKTVVVSRFTEGDEIHFMLNGHAEKGTVQNLYPQILEGGIILVTYSLKERPMARIPDGQAFPTLDSLIDFVHKGKNLEIELPDGADISEGKPIADRHFTELDWKLLSERLEPGDDRFISDGEFVGRFVENVIAGLVVKLREAHAPKEISLADITFSEKDWDDFSAEYGENTEILPKESFIGKSLKEVIGAMFLNVLPHVVGPNPPQETGENTLTKRSLWDEEGATAQDIPNPAYDEPSANFGIFTPTGAVTHSDGSPVEAAPQEAPVVTSEALTTGTNQEPAKEAPKTSGRKKAGANKEDNKIK